jgi:hypothetical protein
MGLPGVSWCGFPDPLYGRKHPGGSGGWNSRSWPGFARPALGARPRGCGLGSSSSTQYACTTMPARHWVSTGRRHPRRSGLGRSRPQTLRQAADRDRPEQGVPGVNKASNGKASSSLVGSGGRGDSAFTSTAGKAASQSKLNVPRQCHEPSESAVTSAWASNPANFPVPPENVAVPLLAARSSTTWPFAVFPDPASRTTSVSRVPSPAASA